MDKNEIINLVKSLGLGVNIGFSQMLFLSLCWTGHSLSEPWYYPGPGLCFVHVLVFVLVLVLFWFWSCLTHLWYAVKSCGLCCSWYGLLRTLLTLCSINSTKLKQNTPMSQTQITQSKSETIQKIPRSQLILARQCFLKHLFI